MPQDLWIVKHLGLTLASLACLGVFLAMLATGGGSRAVLAVAITTIRSSLRSHVVHLILFFLLLTVAVLPVIIASDGTPQGLLQVSLTYTLGLVGMLLSVVTVWLGCTVLTDDIEGYQAHMVLSKPLSRPLYWLGKLLGILLLQLVLLTVAAVGIYWATMWRYSRSNFTVEQQREIRQELMVGRRLFAPEPVDVERLVNEEFARRLQSAPAPQGMTEAMVKNSLRTQLAAQLTDLPAGGRRVWMFRNLPAVADDQAIDLRFRFFVDSATSKDQRPAQGILWVLDPARNEMMPYGEYPVQSFMGGVYHTLKIDPAFLREHRQLVIAYENLDTEPTEDGQLKPGKSVVFQFTDGPHVLMPVTGFLANYLRAIALIFCQLVFLAVVGCVCGALLSSPVAIFLSFSYIILGMVLLAMQPARPEDEIIPRGVMYIFYLIRVGASHIIVSINEFNQVSTLVRGELIEVGAMLLIVFKVLVLRGTIIAALGAWLLNRRELGLVVRR